MTCLLSSYHTYPRTYLEGFSRLNNILMWYFSYPVTSLQWLRDVISITLRPEADISKEIDISQGFFLLFIYIYWTIAPVTLIILLTSQATNSPFTVLLFLLTFAIGTDKIHTS